MSKTYWENRYKNGGTSGAGSRGAKGRARLKYLLKHFDPKEDTIVDYGCGDLALWGGGAYRADKATLPFYYIGVDYSKHLLEANERAYPMLTWLSPERYLDYFRNHARAEVVICFDVIYHQILYGDLVALIGNLCRGSKDRIIVSNWLKSPFGNRVTDNAYQYYRPNELISELFSKHGFDLHETHVEGDGLNVLLTYRARSDKGLS